MNRCKTDSIEPEICCGHQITTQTKKLWRVELDLAEKLRSICEKHNIKYYAGGGTLLGAIRHDGFIPWDDDMDFFMSYSNYKKFCEVAPSELEYPYAFFSNFTMCRIRRSDTTGCTEYELDHANPSSNLGIFIDIFPLTKVPDSKILRKMHYCILRILRLSNRKKDVIIKKKAEGSIKAIDYFDPRVLVWKFVETFFGDLTKVYMNICTMFERSKTKDIGLTSFMTYNKAVIWPRKMYGGEVEWHTFESIRVPIPKHYDAILKHQFGDYHMFVKGAAQHTMPICDPDVPYKEKLKDKIAFE